MQPTLVLVQEHRVIERVIAALETAANKLERGEPVRPGFFLDGVDFIRGYADGCHHHKEEGALFPALAEAGVPATTGPVAVILAEHEQGRQFTRAMADAVPRWQAGENAAISVVIENARGYAALLRQHIHKEDAILFPLSEQRLGESQKAKLTAEFERIEREDTGTGIHEKFLALAGKLEKEIGVGEKPET